MKFVFLIASFLLCRAAAVSATPVDYSEPVSLRAEKLVALASDEEKKRVPKEEKDKKEQQEEERKRQHHENEKDQGSCWGACFFDFMDALFSDDETETNASPLATDLETGSAVEVLGTGVLLQADSSQSVMLPLWSGPGNEKDGYAVLDALPAGTPVEVTNRQTVEGGETWLEVQTRDGGTVFGWVQASSVDWVSFVVPAETPPELPSPDEHANETRPPFGLVLGADVSYVGLVGPVEVREEYEGGVRFGFNALYATRNTLQVGIGAGYSEANGDPRYNYDYASDTRRDSPTDSQLQIFDANLRLGQYLPVGSKVRIYWGLGAVYYWVKESADIDVLSLPSELPLRTSHASKTRWCWGADTAVGGSYPLAARVHAGLQARVFWIPWDGKRLESLTLDHIGTKTVVGVTVSANVRFDVF